jgi:2-polyprenyl-6-methoxyphenol hydroxylase-like FAD-dependent oxidoreductase
VGAGTSWLQLPVSKPIEFVMPPVRQRRALVIGGSLGGLFAANLLRSIGWDAVVFERAQEDLSGRGAGLGTQQELLAILRQLGVALDSSVVTEVRSRICLGPDGKVVSEVPVRSVTTAWDRIYRGLRHALPDSCYRVGYQLTGFRVDRDSVSARFANGSHAEGDLLIGADGIRSTVRKQLLPDAEPSYAGYIAWRCAASEQDVPIAFRELAFHHMNFCFPDGELALTVPMCRSGEDESLPRRVQITWFRPVALATLPALCTDASGHCHGISIPPPSIRKEVIEEMNRQAKTTLPPQVALVLDRAIQPILQPLFDFESPQLTFGRAVLLGDAAFVARPHVGTGVTKAALDAKCLVDALLAEGDNLNAALARYEDKRSRYGRWLVQRGRYLGAYLTAQNKPRQLREVRELYRTPDVVMREFGAAGAGATNAGDLQ